MSKKWTTRNGYIVQQILSSNSPLLISNETTHILVDTGLKKNWIKINDKLNRLVPSSEKLSAVILTHTHHDHVENAMNLKNTYACAILVHQEEAPYLAEGASLYNIGKSSIFRRDYDPVVYDRLISSSYSLEEYGFKAYILHTPGHSSGSVSIIIDDEIALIGDALGDFETKTFAKNKRIASMDSIKSLAKLVCLNCSLYIPSHGSKVFSHPELEQLYNLAARSSINKEMNYEHHK